MSDKIINGIDVSECPLYYKNTGCYHTFNGECVQDSCAVYKWLLELKRLQQQIEAYQLSENEAKEIIAELKHKNKKLRKENEELKEKSSQKSNLIWYIFHCSKIETIQRLLYEYYECINDDRYNEKRVKKFWDDIFHLQQRKKYKSKYKKALEEIRSYCDEQNLKADYTACFITNKIDEVLND